MRKTILLAGCSVLLHAAAHASSLQTKQQGYTAATAAVAMHGSVLPHEAGITATFNVRIELVDIHGNPVTGGTGLRDYWARNEATGTYYEPGGQEDADKFTDLPAGTYTFGAYNGVWDGAVSKQVTLGEDAVGPDGYIVVQLTYWVE